MSTPPGGRGEGRRDPETGGRPLADILREAGIESPTRGWRRRGDDLEDTGVRQRGSEASQDTGRVADGPQFGRRASDRPEAGRNRAGDRPEPGRRGGDRPEPGRRAGDRGSDGPPSAPTPVPERRRARAEPSTAAIPGLRPSRKPGVPGAGPATGVTRPATAKAAPAPSTGPIPVVRADDPPLLEDEALAPREGVLAWLRFGGELLLALAAGVGIYFLFTVLWEQLPYLAVLLAPLAVAGLVGGVGAWRQRQDREPAGVRLVTVLVFAGTLLTIAPAAGLLSTG